MILAVQAAINALITGAMFSLISIGLTLVFGTLEVVNFAHGDFYMLGAYISFWMLTLYGLNPVFSIIISFVTIFVLGILIEKLTIYPLRIKTDPREFVKASILVTTGLSIFLENFSLYIWGSWHRAVTYYYKGMISIGNICVISIERLIFLVVSIVLVLSLYEFLRKTFIGKAIYATGQNNIAARLVGIDPDSIYTLTFALSVGITAVAGGLLLPITGAYPTVGLRLTLIAFVVAISGGLDNVYGTSAAGFLIGFVDSFVTIYYSSTYAEIIEFIIMVIILVYRPEGIMGGKR